jgi:hypothetical protein
MFRELAYFLFPIDIFFHLKGLHFIVILFLL